MLLRALALVSGDSLLSFFSVSALPYIKAIIANAMLKEYCWAWHSRVQEKLPSSTESLASWSRLIIEEQGTQGCQWSPLIIIPGLNAESLWTHLTIIGTLARNDYRIGSLTVRLVRH